MIFFYLIIFISYILSFGLVGLWTIRLLVQVFTLPRRGCDNHKCHNKNPRYEMGLRCEWRHAQKKGAGIFGDFWKKQLVESWTWAKAVQLGATGCAARLLGQLVPILTPGSPARGWLKNDVGTVSIVKIVSLSPHVEKLKVKKWINVSYLNYRESSVFRDFFAYEHLTYSYFGYATLRVWELFSMS